MRTPPSLGHFIPKAVALLFVFGILSSPPGARAADRIKANNTTNLNNTGSWSGGVPDRGNMAVWTDVVTGANTSPLGGNVNWQGIRIANPGGLVTIGPGGTLTLGAGQAGTSIDMNAATQDLTIQSDLTLRSAYGQLWNIASGRTLTLETGLFTRGAGATLNIQGAGSVLTTTIFNAPATPLIGPWATVGTGTAARYATVDGSNMVVGYTGGTAAATAAAATDTSGLVNYDVAAVGALGAGASFNTLRYTGAAGTISGNFTGNGILNSGSGALTLSGNVTIGSDRELVLTNGDGSSARDLTFSGIIGDSPSGASGLTKAGLGVLTLSGANTYNGVTNISRGRVILTSTGTLGSTAGGTRIGISGRLTLAGGITTSESIFLDDLVNAFSSANMIENLGTNTLTGAIRMSDSIRWQSGDTLNVTGGISTTNGTSGSSMVMQAGTLMNITGKPIANGTGQLYMDNGGRTIALGVVGSTYGSQRLLAGTMQTDVANALSRSAQIDFGISYSASAATLNLNGNNQTAGGIASSVFLVTGAFDRVITSPTAATLTVNQTANTTFDGRMTGQVSLVKAGTGILTLTGASTTTGGLTVNGGTVNLNFARATGSASGASAVSNYLSPSAPLTLGGGTFQLTGRNNGTVSSLAGANWNHLASSNGGSVINVTTTAGLAPGQLITGGTGLPAGAYVVSILSGTQFVINANTTATQTATTITATPNSFTTSQTFTGLVLNPGASAVTVTIPSSGSDGTVLNLGAITPNPGATVHFTLPGGTQSATNGITTSTLNDAGGILGGWARVGNNWAINSTNTAGGNIAALAAYTDVNRLGGAISSALNTNVRLIEGGASGSVTPAAAGTTDINTLLQSATGGTATYDPGTTDVLRLGAAGGIMVASNAGALTVGAAANDGILTAGGIANTAGTIYLTNNHASNLLTINSAVADNGSGVVDVTTSGPGIVVLTGANTYTGRTTVGGGTLRISSEQNLGANPLSATANQLTLAGGTLNATATFSLDDTHRGITLAAAGGTISVNSGSTLTVANVIAGAGNLTASGTGTLALHAANTFTGTTFANNGTLALGHVDALRNSTLTTATAGNVTFTVAGTNTYALGGLAGNDTVALGANSIRVGSNHETTIFSGNLTGTGGLTKVGNGTLNLTTANSFSGDTRIEGGMIVLANVNALQNSTLDTGDAGIQSANFTLAEGTTYNLGGLKGSANLDLALSHLSVGSNHQSTTFAGVLQGAFNNNLTKVGTGTLTLAGNNTHLGTTTVSAGSLVLGGTNLSSITVAAGANLGGEGSTGGDVLFLGPAHTLEIDAATTAALGSMGGGSLNVTALNVGGFTINIVGAAPGVAPVKVLTYGSGGFIGNVDRFTLGTHVASGRGAGSFSDNGIGAIFIDLGYVTNTWVGGHATNPSFWDIGTTANWTNATDSLFQNGDDVVFANGALNLTPVLQSNATVGTATFSNTTGTNYVLSSAAGQTLTLTGGLVANGSGNVTIASNLAGNGTLTRSGTGTLTLTGTNSFAGATTITGGTLRLGNESGLGAAPALFAAGHLTLDGAGATLTATASFTLDDATRGITLGSGGGSFGADAATTLTIGNAISGPGAMTKVGAGTLVLTAANTYTGLTTVSAGTLELNSAGGNAIAGDSVAGTTDLQVNTGATLRLAAADQIANDATVSLSGGTWNLNGQNETIRNLTAVVATTVPALTLGSGNVLTVNRVDWDNTGSNTTSNLTGGTLRFVADGATQPVFDTNYVGEVNIASTVEIAATSLTFRANTFYTNVNGKITGAGMLVYDATGGAGGITLANGTNDYSGGTRWTSTSGPSGAWNLFTVTASGALGSGAVSIQGGNQNTWTTAFSGAPSAFTFTGATSHANAFGLTGAATLSVGTPAGDTATGDNVTLSGTFDLDTHRLFLRGRGTGTISGVISGSGGVTKIDNPGTWILSGTNTFTGQTTVSAGTLLVNGDNSAATGTVTVATGATLGGNGVIGGDTTINGTLSTGALATVGSVGTLDFSGNDLTFGDGSFWLVDLVQGVVDSSDSILVDALTIGANSTLTFNMSGVFSGDEVYTLATYSSPSGTFANFATSGVYTIGGNSFLLDYGTNALTLTAIPEPGTLGLLGLAFVACAFRRIRKRRGA
ncbi:MAG: autotransporter-associated beta strand repeat-containing protein [Patescibacteria group bacterium]|nr:autotransporter-associated beta strand repeat-containing protein [Patescibacteria group bacterium]